MNKRKKKKEASAAPAPNTPLPPPAGGEKAAVPHAETVILIEEASPAHEAAVLITEAPTAPTAAAEEEAAAAVSSGTADAPAAAAQAPGADAGMTALFGLLAALPEEERTHLTAALSALIFAMKGKSGARPTEISVQKSMENAPSVEISEQKSAENVPTVEISAQKNTENASAVAGEKSSGASDPENAGDTEGADSATSAAFLAKARREADAMIAARLEQAHRLSRERAARAAHRRILPPISPYRETAPPPATVKTAPRDLDEASRAASAVFRFAR